MTNPFQQGSSGLPESNPNIPGRRFSHATVAAGGQPNTPPPYLSHPGRTSVISQLLNSTDEAAYNPTGSHRHNTEHSGGQQNGAGMSGNAASPWARHSQLPSFSRAYDLYMGNAVAADGAATTEGGGFFVPSYLQGSAYVQMLEESHREKMHAHKEGPSQQATAMTGLATSSSSVSLHSKPAIHRGINQYVVEKPSSVETEGPISPLPTRLNKDDKHMGLDVLADGLEVRYAGPRGQSEREHEAYSIRADSFMPPQCGIYYFEVTILAGKRDDTTIGIGFSDKSVSLARPPGWEPDSHGYHGDDGHCYAAHNGGKPYGPPFTAGDVVGCGINFKTSTAFFTKNGVNLGPAFRDVKGKLYPSVGLKKAGEHIRINFGQTPFTYDINGMMAEEKERLWAEIRKTSTAGLVPGLDKETDLIQALVFQYLEHDGYPQSAKAFAEDLQKERRNLTIDPNAPVEEIVVKEDEHAIKRQRIRHAVLEGDIDKALKHTNTFYPNVLRDNEQVYFHLRCRKFVEMVRTAAEMRLTFETKKHNGHIETDVGMQGMDVERNGTETGALDTQMDGEDGVKKHVSLDELEAETLLYGQALQAEFKNDPRKEVAKALEDIYALLAYTNPLKEKDVAGLLDKKGRASVAEELNSAILLSLGKSSRSALEQVYAQTSVLLEDLRENGGPGAFVSLRDIFDAIPKTQSS